MDKKYCIDLKRMGIWDRSVCHFCREPNCGDRRIDSYVLDEECTHFKRITTREKKRYGIMEDNND